MVDMASQIGGGLSTNDVQDFPQSLEGFYQFNNGDLFLELGRGGDVFDGTGGTGDTVVFAEGGRDALFGDANNDVFLGGGGRDSIDAGDGDNFVSGGLGDDNLSAGVGDDTLDGGDQDDTIDGGNGDNLAFGGSGDDVIFAGIGDDTLIGGSGNDIINGFAGDDLMVGGTGNDTLIGGADDDTLIGGTGSDIYFFDDGFGDDVITEMSPGDRIYLTNDINGFTIDTPADVAPFVSGGVDGNGDPFTLITLGTDSIRIENMDSSDFLADIANKIVIQ